MKRRMKRLRRLLSIILFILCVIAGVLAVVKSDYFKEIPYQEVTVEESTFSGKFYYETLSEEEKLAYREIWQGISENVEDIYLHGSSAKEVNRLFAFVLKDHPEIFWCTGSVSSTAYEKREDYTVMNPEYTYSKEEKEEKQLLIDEAVAQCLSGISQDASEYEKVLYVYEYIVNNVEYDLEAADSQNICSVFINKRSVCAGYSKAMQYLLERLGVFCTYITGNVDIQTHAWNLVMCEGDYYYVDVTWGDPIFQVAGGGSVSQDNISYDYMCCDDIQLFQTHIPEESVPLPACTKMDCNYYVKNGMYYTEYHGETALQAMNNTISAQEESTVFKYANAQIYQQAKTDILDNQVEKAAQNLARWYGLREVRYGYIDSEESNKIIIYWYYT